MAFSRCYIPYSESILLTTQGRPAGGRPRGDTPVYFLPTEAYTRTTTPWQHVHAKQTCLEPPTQTLPTPECALSSQLWAVGEGLVCRDHQQQLRRTFLDSKVLFKDNTPFSFLLAHTNKPSSTAVRNGQDGVDPSPPTTPPQSKHINAPPGWKFQFPLCATTDKQQASSGPLPFLPVKLTSVDRN